MRYPLSLLPLAASGIALALASPARADSCHPTFGDEALTWVTTRVPQQSHDLADADYHARAQNFQLEGRASILARSEAEAADLDAIDRELQTLDQFAGTEEQVAVRRQEVSQLILAALYRVKSDLTETRRRVVAIDITPSKDYFVREGLSAVGRATLLSSVQDLGDSTATTLSGHYSIYFSVTLNADGTYNTSDLTNGGVVATVGGAMAESEVPIVSWIGWGIVAGVTIYEAIEGDVCLQRFDQQYAKVKQAISLLPSELISSDDQWALYQQRYGEQLAIFKPSSTATLAFLDSLDSRWQILFAANAARIAAAQSALTDSKIKDIQQSFKNGDPSGVFKDIAITRVATDIGNINGFTARTPTDPRLNCSGAIGISAREDAMDGLTFAKSEMAEIRKGGDFSPLFDLIDNSIGRIDRAASQIPPAGRARRVACKLPSQGVQAVRHTATAASPGKEGLQASLVAPVPSRMRQPTSPGAQFRLAALQSGNPVGSVSTCVVVSNGGVYTCGQPSDGSPYDGEFNHGSGNPESDVLWGSNDGGYASDARRASQQVAAASANIASRIFNLNSRTSAVAQAVPGWLSMNDSALGQLTQDTTTATNNDSSYETGFEQSTAAINASIKQDISNFLQSANSVDASRNLISGFQGVDLSVPSAYPSQITPTVPVITGITTGSSDYQGRSTDVAKRIERERLKDNSSLTGTPLSLANQLVDTADSLEKIGSDGLASDLVLDAASIRYAQSGSLGSARITVVNDDGSLASIPYQPANGFPANALVQKAREFASGDTLYSMQSSTLRQALSNGASDSQRRGAVLDRADNAEQLAKSAFASGDVLTAGRLQKFALGMVDIATRFIPGINWGRDVYEATTGKDLFTGNDLDDFNRTVAILGAISGGVLDDAVGAAHATEELEALEKLGQLGLPEQRCKDILKAAKEFAYDEKNLTTHALDEMEHDALGEVSKSEVKDAINNGEKWYNTAEQTIVSIERDPASGEIRVAAAMDMDNQLITTAYREAKTDAQLLVDTIGGKGRYIPLIR
jgi:hypothetical protein